MSTPHSSDSVGYSGPRQPSRPRGLAFVLSIIMLAIYCGFVLLVAYNKPLLGSLIAPGLSWGILLGALVIIVAWVLTFIYVAASNRSTTRR